MLPLPYLAQRLLVSSGVALTLETVIFLLILRIYDKWSSPSYHCCAELISLIGHCVNLGSLSWWESCDGE